MLRGAESPAEGAPPAPGHPAGPGSWARSPPSHSCPPDAKLSLFTAVTPALSKWPGDLGSRPTGGKITCRIIEHLGVSKVFQAVKLPFGHRRQRPLVMTQPFFKKILSMYLFLERG